MTNKEIFIALLEKAGYKNAQASTQEDFNKRMETLELDRENVFHAIYGDKLIAGRGKKKMKEYLYRLMEAENDLREGLIKITMHYLLMQIHIKALTL